MCKAHATDCTGTLPESCTWWAFCCALCNLRERRGRFAGQENDAPGDGEYAFEGSGDDDEATLEEEDALAAQDGADRLVRSQLTEDLFACWQLIHYLSANPLMIFWKAIHETAKFKALAVLQVRTWLLLKKHPAWLLTCRCSVSLLMIDSFKYFGMLSKGSFCNADKQSCLAAGTLQQFSMT